MVYVTRHIDWVSFSIKAGDHPSAIFPLLSWKFIGRGKHGYKSAYVCSRTNARAEQDSADPEMGTAFQLSSDALDAIRREYGATDDGLANRIVSIQGKASRLDLAINVHDGRLTPSALCKAVRSGSAKARASMNRLIQGKNGDVEGDTFYIGSKTSDVQLRAYNKAAELGIVNGEAWLRVELQLRRARANEALKSCAANGTDKTISGYMGNFLVWRDVEYKQALGEQSVEPVDIPRKETNRRRWLMTQVPPAVAKEILLDDEFALKFWSSVQEELAKLKSAG